MNEKELSIDLYSFKDKSQSINQSINQFINQSIYQPINALIEL
jgi:hypothetical protein